jgi:hypothetical protein
MLSKPLRSRTVAVLALVLPLLALGGGAEAKKGPPPVPWTGPVPKADCGPNDRAESGLQGQTTRAERESGDSELGYNCNMELVGQFQGDGASWQFAWLDDCGYYDTANTPEQQRPGTVVIDASDPRNPRATAILDTPSMLDPWESLKVNKKRKLLAGVERGGPGFAIYDLSADCRNPVLKASIQLAGSGSNPFRAVEGHAGNFSPDGMTYYATQSFRGLRGIMPIIDVSDPSNPKHLLNWQFPGDGRAHDLSFSKDGTRAYSPQPGQFGTPVTGSSFGPNGLVILDVSDIQFRRPNPQIRVISTLFWEDGGQAQNTLPVTIKGRPYLIFTDELGSGGVGGRPGACARGLPPYGFARIIDISDERNPKIVAKLMLEVHDPANCPVVLSDPQDPSFVYDGHYCGVDDTRHAKLLACGYFRAGMRVFDIRDPYRPKEVAYYKSPAQREAFLPGSNLYNRTPDPHHGTPGGGDRTTDWATSNVRWRKHRGETHLWFTSQDNGFQIVRFTRDVLRDDDDDDGGEHGRDDGRRGSDRDDDD